MWTIVPNMWTKYRPNTLTWLESRSLILTESNTSVRDTGRPSCTTSYILVIMHFTASLTSRQVFSLSDIIHNEIGLHHLQNPKDLFTFLHKNWIMYSIKGTFITAFDSFFVIEHVCIVHKMRTMKKSHPIDLEDLHKTCGGKLNRCRLEKMLVLPRHKKHSNVQKWNRSNSRHYTTKLCRWTCDIVRKLSKPCLRHRQCKGIKDFDMTILI